MRNHWPKQKTRLDGIFRCSDCGKWYGDEYMGCDEPLLCDECAEAQALLDHIFNDVEAYA